MRAAGLGPGAREAFAPEGLHAHDRADHVAVNVGVADLEAAVHGLDRLVDPAVDAERQAVAGRGDGIQELVEPAALPAHHMQDRPEHLALEPADAVDLESARREEETV